MSQESFPRYFPLYKKMIFKSSYPVAQLNGRVDGPDCQGVEVHLVLRDDLALIALLLLNHLVQSDLEVLFLQVFIATGVVESFLKGFPLYHLSTAIFLRGHCLFRVTRLCGRCTRACYLLILRGSSPSKRDM